MWADNTAELSEVERSWTEGRAEGNRNAVAWGELESGGGGGPGDEGAVGGGLGE